jgi:hypothetical protein
VHYFSNKVESTIPKKWKGSDSFMILPYQAKEQQRAGASETHSKTNITHSGPKKDRAV